MPQKVTKAILPIAGLGTRFLPATKSMPKEMMTLVDRPLIQYAMDEAMEAGITDFIFVTAKGKGSLVDYFDKASELETALKQKGKTDLLEELARTDLPSGAISTIRQQQALGLGHAVWCARRLIGDEPFAVILPDDVIMADEPCLKQMVDAQAETGGCMVAAMEVAPEHTSKYGILDVSENGDDRAVKVKGMVEKPEPADAPSNLAVIGRYILTPEVLKTLDTQETGKGGEIQLTDAIAAQIDRDGVWGLKFAGRRFDCGAKAGFLQATIAFGLQRPDLKDDLAAFIKSIDPAELN